MGNPSGARGRITHPPARHLAMVGSHNGWANPSYNPRPCRLSTCLLHRAANFGHGATALCQDGFFWFTFDLRSIIRGDAVFS